ncbi:MAG: ribosomal-processing cysteine protease Prp [Oscillospiraceae bacterium]|nr:ribosomal-processing cysteine protease Prp [Oscillospiraceae bacterium]MDD4367521.1 ribosomal-processing cysteine protease Prp [Oscillospiraceae bacterium]
MIKVDVTRDEQQQIRRIEARGHAGYAPNGEDIICAAVTAVLTTCIAALTDLAGIEPLTTIHEGDIMLELPDPEPLSRQQQAQAATIMSVAALGCKQIEFSYGQRYVSVKDEQTQAQPSNR